MKISNLDEGVIVKYQGGIFSFKEPTDKDFIQIQELKDGGERIAFVFGLLTKVENVEIEGKVMDAAALTALLPRIPWRYKSAIATAFFSELTTAFTKNDMAA